MTFRMPAEWEAHERTLVGFPCRASSWGDTFEAGRREFAAAANTICEFEPVTMVCASIEDEAQARVLLSEKVRTVVHPMDGSWLRDNGPIFVVDGKTRRARHFRFNAWGERHASRDRDARLGTTLAVDLGDAVDVLDVVLEGGAISVDGSGTLVLTEGCVMHPNRNWHLSRDQVEAELRWALGVREVIWLPQGLEEDLAREEDRMHYGTDGHIDLFFDFIGEKQCLMLSVEEDNPNARHLVRSREILKASGIEVIGFPYLSGFEANGRHYVASYLNFYVCNRGVVVPVADTDPDLDQEALSAIAACWPWREVVAVPMRAGPMQGGAVHCLTQQVPIRPRS